MVEKSTNGDCYICGANLSKIAMKNHIMKHHSKDAAGQECCLLKVEGLYDKDYWLYIDIPIDETLSELDSFLRNIWLECCGHMSSFYIKRYDEIDENLKLKAFSPGDKFFHIYDYGSTTELALTVIGTTSRKRQKDIVRLLARNTPPDFRCKDCGEKAVHFCEEFIEPFEPCFYCDDCCEKHADDDHYLHPVTNSSRMGVCGYDGELDRFEFLLSKITKGQKPKRRV